MKRDLDQMLRAIEHTSPTQPYRAELPATIAAHRATVRRRMVVPAVALLTLLLMLTLMTVLSRRDAELPPDELPPENITDLPADELPPWRSGKLSVTTLTYGSLTNTDLSIITPPSLIPLSAQTTQSQNISIALRPDATIRGSVSASLLRIQLREGEHRTCAAVYYDIDSSEIFCLSCELYDAIVDTDLYEDAWLRAILEEGVLTYGHNVSGKDGYEQAYALLYQTVYQHDAQKWLDSERPITAEELGLTEELLAALPKGYVFLGKTLQTYLAKSTYEPRIEIVSFGIEKKQCLFSLLASTGGDKYNYAYGSYLYDFATHTLTRLEGDSIGVAHSVSSDAGASTPHLAYELSRALNIYYLDGYDHIVATVEEVQRGRSSYYIPLHYSVVHYDTEKNTASILQNKEKEHYANFHTTRAAQYRDGIVFYAIGGSGGKTNGYYFTDLDGIGIRLTYGGKSHLMTAEQVFWIEDEAYVRMHIGTDEYYKQEEYAYFRLRDGARVTAQFDDGTLHAPDHIFYQYDGVDRIDTRTGERVTLYAGTVLNSVSSRDERYLYLLPQTADRIVCIDRHTGETGEIALPEPFISQLALWGAASYSLYLNPTEDTLTLLYRPARTLRFDGEAFAKDLRESAFFTYLYAGDTAAAMELAATRMLPHYLVDDEPLALTNVDLVTEALALLLQQAFEAQEDAMSQEELIRLFASVGEQLFDHLTYDGDTATVTAQDLEALRCQ